jgi:UDP-glucuronate 4-epimerase
MSPSPTSRTALVTGSAGFIGYHLCRTLLTHGFRVVGLDAMTDYYDVALKRARRNRLRGEPTFADVEGRIETPCLLAELFARHRPDIVVHLAGQAGVRHSIEAPESYVEANLVGTFRLLEAMRAHPPAHALLASTSSVYGATTEMPFRETMRTDAQMSFYAATKKSNEAMAQSYAHLYDLPITMFRFFTVYGPWGRPDMALFKFTRAILDGTPIDVYNHGDMRRDFTYVADLVEAIRRLIDAVPVRPEPSAAIPEDDSLSPVAPWRVVNLGNGEAIELDRFIKAIEDATGRRAIRNLLPMQPGDVPATWADISLATRLTGHCASTPVEEGVRAFVDWYRIYHAV